MRACGGAGSCGAASGCGATSDRHLASIPFPPHLPVDPSVPTPISVTPPGPQPPPPPLPPPSLPPPSSDSVENAQKELALWFSEGLVDNTPVLRGQVRLHSGQHLHSGQLVHLHWHLRMHPQQQQAFITLPRVSKGHRRPFLWLPVWENLPRAEQTPGRAIRLAAMPLNRRSQCTLTSQPPPLCITCCITPSAVPSCLVLKNAALSSATACHRSTSEPLTAGCEGAQLVAPC